MISRKCRHFRANFFLGAFYPHKCIQKLENKGNQFLSRLRLLPTLCNTFNYFEVVCFITACFEKLVPELLRKPQMIFSMKSITVNYTCIFSDTYLDITIFIFLKYNFLSLSVLLFISLSSFISLYIFSYMNLWIFN